MGQSLCFCIGKCMRPNSLLNIEHEYTFFRISSGFDGCPLLPSDQLLSSQTLVLQILAPLCSLACKTTICLFLECNTFTLISDMVVFFCIKILHFQVHACVYLQYETTKGLPFEKACAFLSQFCNNACKNCECNNVVIQKHIVDSIFWCIE